MKSPKTEGPQPFSVSKGSVTVKGYPLARGLWQLSWYAPDGTRGRKAFKDEGDARRFATTKAAELAGQRSHVRTLTSEEAADYEAATAKLPPGVQLLTAVEFYLTRHPANAPRKWVKDVVDEHLADMKARGLSGVYLRNARHYLDRFASDVAMLLPDVSLDIVTRWLRGLGVQPKTQKGVRGLVVGMFNFARDRRYITRELALEIAAVKAPKVVTGEIGTLTPDELHRLLSTANPDELPALALLAFCPLRTAEIARLDWQDIRLAERNLTVNVRVAKVSVRRVVPIPEACVAWLSAVSKASGSVSPWQPDPDGDVLSHQIPLIAKAAGIRYSKNCLRHSCISALMATEQDAARVSLWAGNSPRVVSTSYSDRWTKSMGAAWFGVLPTPPHNVIPKPASPEQIRKEACA